MIDDIRTLVWKESIELMQQGSTKTGSIARQLFIIGFFGIFNPWAAGVRFLTGAGPFPALFAVLLVVTVTLTVEAFAGERERHTLETLLSTRLSDDAILFGKLIASVVYSCAGMVAILILGAATVNLAHHVPGTFLFFSAREIAILLTTIALSSILVSTVAVLISLRAATVRQASQVLAFGMVIPFMVALVAFNRMSPEWRARIVNMFSSANLLQTEIGIVVTVLALIAVLLFIARARFRRAVLILD